VILKEKLTMIPNARFTELLSDIEPSPTTKANASTAHTNLRDHLEYHDDFGERWTGDFLAGSYSRDTAIRPRITEDGQERPDIDIIVVTNYDTSEHPDDVLGELCAALEDEYKVERVNKRSVRVVTPNAEMDVVPVVETSNGYLIPDRETGRWRETNPPEHNNWSSRQNTAFDGRFKKLVKMLKWWRRENPTGKRPKGFGLEVLVSLHAPRHETHLGEAFAQLLENIHAAYALLASVDQKPFIADPAIPSNDILAKVTIPQWKAFIDRIGVHAGYARRAQNEDDMEEATRLWRKIFGERFKSTANPAKASVLGGFAAAAAPAGYTFPDAMAAPSKPRGFA
jgi:hypothetical protein